MSFKVFNWLLYLLFSWVTSSDASEASSWAVQSDGDEFCGVADGFDAVPPLDAPIPPRLEPLVKRVEPGVAPRGGRGRLEVGEVAPAAAADGVASVDM